MQLGVLIMSMTGWVWDDFPGMVQATSPGLHVFSISLAV